MGINGIFEVNIITGGAIMFLMALVLLLVYQNFSNIILSIQLITIVTELYVFAIAPNGRYSDNNISYLLAWSLNLMQAPLYYIYIRSYLSINYRSFKHLWKHFIIFGLFAVLIPIFYGNNHIILVENGLILPNSTIGRIAYILLLGQIGFYTIKMFKYMHLKSYLNHTEYLKPNIVKWLHWVFICLVFLWTLVIPYLVLSLFQVSFSIVFFQWYYLGIVLFGAISIYYVVKNPLVLEDHAELEEVNISEMTLPIEDEVVGEDTKELILLLEYFEEEKPFLKTDLTLQDLEEGTGIHKKKISELLNNKIKKSFYDMVNEYRTKEAILLMKAGVHDNYTLSHLAEEAGFNSRATFNRTFKKITGQTPSQFLNQIQSVL